MQTRAFSTSDAGRARPGVMGRLALAPLLLAALALPGCETFNNAVGSGREPGRVGFVRGFLGGVSAEDPAAALAARDVLSAGGTATDAAVAAGFTLAVTLPSRVGLAGGGACVVYDRRKNEAQAVMFLPGRRTATPAGADRPAAIPLLARGLFALHTRIPGRPFEELVAPAETMARQGTTVSRGLADDLAVVARPLFADPSARALFARPDGTPKQAGEPLVQGQLAAVMTQIRLSGVGDMHQGVTARRLEEAARAAGGGLTLEELRAALPTIEPPLLISVRGGDTLAFLPTPADGGLAAAATFNALQAGQTLPQAAARGQAVAAAWRQRGGDPRPLLTGDVPEAGLGPLPASTALAVFDKQGNAVSCAFTLNNLFGTGRVASGLGMVLAAAPNIGQVQPPLLSAAVGYNGNLGAFRMVVAGSGQHAAPLAVAGPAAGALLRNLTAQDAIEQASRDPGRTQMGFCSGYLPGYESTCVAVTDPRGTGVALGAVDF